jgi:hypothetical protein
MSELPTRVESRGIVEATILRADGTVELVGVVCDTENEEEVARASDKIIRRINSRAFRDGRQIPRDAPGVTWIDRLIGDMRRRRKGG